jgi:hypothetical protein
LGVAFFVAQRIRSNVRELEGALRLLSRAMRSRWTNQGGAAKTMPARTASPPRSVRIYGNKSPFHVFLSYNSSDRREVLVIYRKLRLRGLIPWLDIEQLRPGFSFQEALEEQISSSRAGAVFVGRSNMGPWQIRELRAFLNELVTRGCPVIPVLLPGAKQPPPLPLFLRDMTWVDFRTDRVRALEQLVWGITGRRPANFDKYLTL